MESILYIRRERQRDEYIGKIADAPESELRYFGLAICGNKKQVNKLTGSMPLLR